MAGSGRPTPVSHSFSVGHARPHLSKAKLADLTISSMESISVPSRSNRMASAPLSPGGEVIDVKLVFGHAYQHGGLRRSGKDAWRRQAGRHRRPQLPLR